MLKLICLFYLIFSMQAAEAINPDFYRQKKKKEVLKVKREKGAASLTKSRRAWSKAKEKRAERFTAVRKKQVRARERREKLFDKDLAKKEKFRNRKVAQASKLAKKRRKKSKVGWKEQNLEYGVIIPKPAVKTKK